MPEVTRNTINKSPFKNVYWFARYLINSDQYGMVGKNYENKLLNTVLKLETIISNSQISLKDKFIVCKDIIKDDFVNMARKGTKTANLVQNLIEQLDKDIKTTDDIIVFCLTVKFLIIPTNKALSLVPSNDKEFCEELAKNILDKQGESQTGIVVSLWDEMGVKGCLDAEREVVVEEFTKLVSNLQNLQLISHNNLDDNIILTAFIQEFERRLGQKRKSRGGTSLETVLNFLFDYYNFQSSEKPEHFNADLEIDKWFKCSDGWLIGISCKRTLRERWKQVSPADSNILSSHQIKEVWHIITYDKDLSDEKISTLGAKRQIFYLQDNSEIYKHASNHIGMRDYVRPLSNLVKDIRKNMKKKK